VTLAGAQLPIGILTTLALVYVMIWRPGSWVYTLTVVALYATAVIALNLLVGFSGLLALGQIIFLEIGAYGSAIFTTKYGFNPWLAMVPAAAMSALVAVLLGAVTFRLQGFYFGIGALSLGLAAAAFPSASPFLGGAAGIPSIPPLTLFGVNFGTTPIGYYILAWLVVGASIAIVYLLVNSYKGRAWRTMALRDDVAATLGINTLFYKNLAFAIAAVMTSIAGSLYAEFSTFMAPDYFSLDFVILLIFMLVIGGIRSYVGPVFGAAIYVIVPLYISGLQQYENLVFSVVLLAAFIFKPGGLFGSIGNTYGVAAVLPPTWRQYVQRADRGREYRA
jgi:branched-chain amino acid transport system permease protein